MPNPRGVNGHGPGRDAPITDEERKARNRVYQHAQKHKTNNALPRVRRRVQERCYKWFQLSRPATLAKWMKEEMEAEQARIKDGTSKKYTPILGFVNPQETCPHNGDEYAIGIATACSLCGQVMGVRSTDANNLESLDKMIGGNPPAVVSRNRRRKK